MGINKRRSSAALLYWSRILTLIIICFNLTRCNISQRTAEFEEARANSDSIIVSLV